jgi:GntR family transcriptional regulator, transcriptional repressor for pyruvate dehydrogenase complex
VRLSRLERIRAHVFIAEQLRRQIMLGVLPTGEALPPERELAAMLGVARATVQRAVHVLESDGLVVARRGRGGGTFVIAMPGEDTSRGKLISDVRANRSQIEDSIAFRLAVEPAAASLAAGARSEQDLAELRQIAERAAMTTDDVALTSLDAQFHLSVTAAAHSRLFTEAVERVRLNLHDAILLLPDSSLWQRRSLQEHERILAAIEAGNQPSAQQAVLAHIDHTARSLQALLKAL